MGRRPLMLIGALGQSVSMAVLAITNAPKVTNATYDPVNMVDKSNNSGASIVAAIFLFVFNTFFAIGWLGMTWLTPAEMTPLPVRAACNGISTASNWIFNFLIVLITPIAFANIQYRTYVIFAVINFFIFIATYFIFPETAGRSLEEMDEIFARSSKINPFDVVLVERATPRRYDKHGRPIGLLEDVESNNANAESPRPAADEKVDEKAETRQASVSEHSSA